MSKIKLIFAAAALCGGLTATAASAMPIAPVAADPAATPSKCVGFAAPTAGAGGDQITMAVTTATALRALPIHVSIGLGPTWDIGGAVHIGDTQAPHKYPSINTAISAAATEGANGIRFLPSICCTLTHSNFAATK